MIKSSKCRELDWLSSCYTQLPVQLSFKKFALTSNCRPFWKFRNILDSLILISDVERSLKIMPEKVILMLITSLMTSQHDVKFGLQYSCLNEIVTFFAIQVVVFNQSSLNFTHTCSLVQRIGAHLVYVKGQRITSQCKKVGQILKLS